MNKKNKKKALNKMADSANIQMIWYVMLMICIILKLRYPTHFTQYTKSKSKS